MAGARERDRRHGRRRAEAPELGVYLIGKHARQQSVKVLVRQGRKPKQAGVQPLELAFRHRVEVEPPNALLSARALQPTKENLGRTRIADSALPQTTFDFCVTGGFTDTSAGRGLFR